MEYFYVRRKKDGKVLDIPANSVDATIRTGNFELLGKVAIVPSSTPSVEAPVVKSEGKFICPICGFESSSDGGLRIHKHRKHR